MQIDTLQLMVGLILAVLVAILAWRVGALNASGAGAAIVTGGLVFGLGGLAWAVVLLTFFISSSGLSRLFSSRKAALSEKFSKGSSRDWAQVLANGGLGAFLVTVHAFFPTHVWPWVAYVGAMAAVNADTWATELGVLSPAAPRLITNGQPVERGTSGGVTVQGTLATIAGAALVAGMAVAFSSYAGSFSAPAISLTILAAATPGGVAGSLFDSWLGATIQSIYYCPRCQKETERHPYHSCGCETVPQRGWRWLNNDVVNFASSLMGGGISLLVWILFFKP
jgi:uncharacterized protein (TIGR00297 family)